MWEVQSNALNMNFASLFKCTVRPLVKQSSPSDAINMFFV